MTVAWTSIINLFKWEFNSTFSAILIVVTFGILIPLEAGSDSKAEGKPEGNNKIILEITQGKDGKLEINRMDLPGGCYKECTNHCISILSNNKDILLECVKGCAVVCKDDKDDKE